MKKVIISLLLSLFIISGFVFWLFNGSATTFSEPSKTIVIEVDNIAKEDVLELLVNEQIISSTFLFEKIGTQLKIWDRIKIGKFKFKKGESLIDIARIFKNNKQAEFNLVINKLRSVNDLAKLINKNFSTDSISALRVLKDPRVLSSINADSNTLMFNIIPNTYTFFWSTPVEKMIEKLAVESKKFWDVNNRKSKADQLGLTPLQVYIIASIVEEETNNEAEKGNIASVYMNRLKIGMPLAADPTVKFAVKDFALRRILRVHTQYKSPYNTYINKGLPPGPICTPAIKTIDAVLNAPKTNYLFFVANADMSGTHHFSNTFAEHKQYAAIYHKALTKYLAEKEK
ncbi:MAG: endolytic transglycosylase MltG [Chitinophagaceae bacterium]|nr:endolytic transglycosylase MltG [Chitinophagaceae bacterium]